MFGRKKQKEYRFAFDIEKVTNYFRSNGYMGMYYKKNTENQDKLTKEINRYLEHMEWIKGYESLGKNYMVYHGNSVHWTSLFFAKQKELAQITTRKDGFYSKANQDIENFVVRDEDGMTFYMLRVGVDVITTCVMREQEEEMKRVFTELNTFVYKQEQ